MKNKLDKRVLGIVFNQLKLIVLSFIISVAVIMVIREVILYFVYQAFDSVIGEFISIPFNIYQGIRYTLPIDLNLIMYIISYLITYYCISYKSIKKFLDVVDETREMSEGDLDRVIQISDKGYIGNISKNINEMSSQLRERTIEEKRAQQTKTDLITNVSHDLRTPLTSIIGYLGLIEEDKYKDEVELRYYNTIAYEKSKMLKILIDDLFELTKMQNNSIPMNKIDIDLAELISQVFYQFTYQFKESNTEGRINICDQKIKINADPHKLVRVFDNLISNAIKYGKDGQYIDLYIEKEDDEAIVKIINYGNEISKYDIEFIFDRFYRTEKSRNRSEGGSGLGLSIAKSIIELHNGNISARSNKLETVFEVRLPITHLQN